MALIYSTIAYYEQMAKHIPTAAKILALVNHYAQNKLRNHERGTGLTNTALLSTTQVPVADYPGDLPSLPSSLPDTLFPAELLEQSFGFTNDGLDWISWDTFSFLNKNS